MCILELCNNLDKNNEYYRDNFYYCDSSNFQIPLYECTEHYTNPRWYTYCLFYCYCDNYDHYFEVQYQGFLLIAQL